MNIFKKLLDAFKQPASQETPPILQAEADNQAARLASEACLDRHWSSVGTVERDVLAYLISPSFAGGPHWPSTRQAYRVVRRGDSIILATEGLSDPFDDDQGQGNGFEMELFVETPDIPEHARGPLGEVDPFKRSWAFELIENIAKTVADAGGITQQLERYGALSLELPGFSESHHIASQVPKHFVTDDDSIGVLLGGPAPDFPTRLQDMPLSPVTLVPVVLITAAELEYIRAGGGAARADLVSRLQAAGVGHVSSLQRASVL
ncbi:suppressor of fused domain protein [Pseudomonas sp. B21-032]|uniref:suppressor of fused domain protein n=1 Tax=Pseudomonas sp. B21-032 TaxID=2895483 RepID=UPI0021607987|nr:suppressor of fused domain protein [Pseudomonas sp. B21-032]UVL59935.1 suppressor of fused domain protein [Pseudomonas sp. B21-032]